MEVGGAAVTRKLVNVEAVRDAVFVGAWDDEQGLMDLIDALPIEASVTDATEEQPVARISFAPTVYSAATERDLDENYERGHPIEPAPSPLTARVTPEMLQARELTLGLLDAIDEAMRKGDQLAAGEAFAELRCAWRDMPLPTAKAQDSRPYDLSHGKKGFNR